MSGRCGTATPAVVQAIVVGVSCWIRAKFLLGLIGEAVSVRIAVWTLAVGCDSVSFRLEHHWSLGSVSGRPRGLLIRRYRVDWVHVGLPNHRSCRRYPYPDRSHGVIGPQAVEGHHHRSRWRHRCKSNTTDVLQRRSQSHRCLRCLEKPGDTHEERAKMRVETIATYAIWL